MSDRNSDHKGQLDLQSDVSHVPLNAAETDVSSLVTKWKEK